MSLLQALGYGMSFILLAVCLMILKQAVRCYNVYQTFKKLGIPGPKPDLFLGNLGQLGKRACPNDVINDWISKYGNVFGYFEGDVPRLVINDVDIIKEIMFRRNKSFPNRVRMAMSVMPLSRSVVFVEDEEWKNQRRVITPAFSPNKLRHLTESMNSSVDILLEEILKRAEVGMTFDIYERLRAMTLDAIAKCALAMDVDCQRNPEDSFLKAVKAFFEMALNPVVYGAIMFPPLRILFTFINNYLTSGQMTDFIVANTQKVIELRRKEAVSRTDLLQLLLNSADEDKRLSGNNSYHMDDYCAMANAYAFLLAGYETTSTNLGFTFDLLAKNEDVQERLYREICESLTEGQNPTYETISEMQYLDQVVNESLRIYPPLSLFITRVCQEECEINGQVIPKDMAVQVPVWHIHHDPQLYPDPWKFDPERFSPENREKIHPAAFMPFGIGPRNCIGMRFALLEAKLTVARVIQNFRLTVSSETEDPLEVTCPTVISYPKNGVKIKAFLR